MLQNSGSSRNSLQPRIPGRHNPALIFNKYKQYFTNHNILPFRHKADSQARELRGINGTNIEIMNVESCSLYEFKITAVSRFGESKPIILVQYTGASCSD